MSKAILVTGAASGMGFEYVKLAAQDHYDVVLVDINTEKIEETRKQIASEYHVNVYAITADLSRDDAAKQIYDACQEQNIEVYALINNAGFGDFGRFTELPYEKERKLLGVNVISLIYLTHLFGNDMVKRGEGRILNVASIAAYIPGPFMPMYYATKAFVWSFSEAVAVELRGTGVTVTTLSPGPTKTGFEKNAKMEGSKMFTLKPLQACTADQVARCGYNAMMKGKLLAHPHPKYELCKITWRMAPEWLRLPIVTYVNIGKLSGKDFKTKK